MTRPPYWSSLAIFVLTLVFGAVVTQALLSTLAPPSASTAVSPGPPLAPRVARQLVLVIVDGLRYDVATDPALMPRFSAAMRERSSGEVWAGRVSMTSSAVLTLGTGQRGRLEQVVRNIKAAPPEHNSWLANARAAGLRVGVVGDPAWEQMYGPHLWEYRGDPEGVAIDVDFNPQAFRNARALLARRPDVLVLHFVTPDHQGHAYGIRSDRYRRHIHEFDGLLFDLLGELPADATVIVTSDHGAADSGTHGADVPVQRRSPLFAYGPGIRAGFTELGMDQLDLSVLLPLLVGVAPPAHGTGALLAGWLDRPETEVAALACRLAERTVAYGEVALGAPLTAIRDSTRACRTGPPRGQIIAANAAIRRVDEEISARTGLSPSSAALWLAAIGVLGVALSTLLVGRVTPREHLVALGVIGFTAWLVLVVERLPGVYPNVVRAGFFVFGNVALLVAPRLVGAAADGTTPGGTATLAEWLTPRRRGAVAVLLALLLVGSYTATTRPEAYVAAAILAPLLAGPGFLLERRVPVLRAVRGGFTPRSAAALGVGLLLLLPVLLRENGNYSALFAAETLRRFAAAAAAAAWVAHRARGARLPLPHTLLALTLVALPVLSRHAAAPYVGRGAWLGVTLLGLYGLARRRQAEAQIALFAGFLWVTRDVEVFAWSGALLVATVVGERLGATAEGTLGKDILSLCLVTVLGFALCFLVRVGMQDGVEFGGIDWGAAAFHDPQVSPYLVGAALVAKYALGAFLVGACLASTLDPGRRSTLCRGLSLCFVARAIALSAMFFVAGGSYWTAMRVLGDLPTTLCMGLGAIALFLWTEIDAPAEMQAVADRMTP